MSCFLELLKCRIREFIREPSAFVFVLTMPVVLMVCLGYAVNTGFKPLYRIIWHPAADLPNVGLQAEMNAAYTILDKQSIIDLRVSDKDDLRSSQADMIIKVTTAENKRSGGLKLVFNYHYDPNSPTAMQAKMFVENLLIRIMNPFLSYSKTDNEVELPGQRYIDFLIPGLLVFSLLTTTMFGLGMTLVAFRRDGLLRKFLTTPLPMSKLIFSFITGRILIYVLEAAIILGFAWMIFDFHIFGSLLDMAAVMILGLLCIGYLSILIGSRINNTGAYNGLSNLVMFPLILLSGMYFSRDHFPDWLQIVAKYLPTSLIVDSLRGVMVGGHGIEHFRIELIALMGMTGFFAFLSHRLFRTE